ncbi:MAG: ABC-F family ATP-binding cassette domain-containing protein, partial [Alkalispirochaeta sp.]
MIAASNLHVSFGAQTILDSVSITIDREIRAGLVGSNGSGKTTLLQILAGRAHPDEGEIIHAKESSPAYLPQRLDVEPKTSVHDLADLGFAFEHQLVAERSEHAELLQNKPSAAKALSRVAEIDEVLEHHGYYEREAEIGRVLQGLGFSPSDIERPLGEFSGGWQMRASLARTLLTRADILLLDEPTNYLDSEARLWLAQFIKNYDGGVVLVSHDRAFLDDSVSVILELFNGNLRRYKGTYTEYEQRRTEELEQLKHAWRRQQEEIQRQEEFIRRFRSQASKARQVQSRVKALEKTERIELPQHLRPISISLPTPPHSGEIMLTIEGASKSYGHSLVLDQVDLTVRRGQRFAVVGLNGAGKSTLLRILSGADTPTHGSIGTGTGVSIAYYAQDSADTLPPDSTVYDYVAQRASSNALPQVRAILGAFLFDEEALEKRLSVLSGGERSRLVMAGLLVQPANLLILDEPTNHLDMTSQQVLARALSDYRGSTIVVSHDRYFLRAVSTDVLALWPRSLPEELRPSRAWRYYPGSYREFEG